MSNSPEACGPIETNDDNFERDVLRRSEAIPVVVDFWADWCQPCRLLGPILDQLAGEYPERFALVKANLDHVPRAAAQFRVQSIPAVYGVRNGRVVDGFLGAMPLDDLRQWLDRFLPHPAEELTQAAERCRANDPQASLELLRQAAATDPRFAPAQILMADVLCDLGDVDAAREQINRLADRGFLEPEAERVRARLELRAPAKISASIEACRTQLESEPDRLDLQLQLAEALAGHAEYAEALQHCLSVVQTDRGELRQRARQTMVDIFRVLPQESELAVTFRRKLALTLF